MLNKSFHYCYNRVVVPTASAASCRTSSGDSALAHTAAASTRPSNRAAPPPVNSPTSTLVPSHTAASLGLVFLVLLFVVSVSSLLVSCRRRFATSLPSIKSCRLSPSKTPMRVCRPTRTRTKPSSRSRRRRGGATTAMCGERDSSSSLTTTRLTY